MESYESQPALEIPAVPTPEQAATLAESSPQVETAGPDSQALNETMALFSEAEKAPGAVEAKPEIKADLVAPTVEQPMSPEPNIPVTKAEGIVEAAYAGRDAATLHPLAVYMAEQRRENITAH